MVVVVHRSFGRRDEDRGATERASGISTNSSFNSNSPKHTQHLHQFFHYISQTFDSPKTPGFNVTSKANGDDEQNKRYEQEIFDFAPSSSIFLPMTAVAVLNLFAFVSGLYGLFAWGEGLSLELMLASFVVVNSLPIYEAMVLRKDDGKLQKGICFLAGILTLVLILGGYFFLK
ncbi:hypothetical protein F2Q68_00029995 [Brassica cretica]|uniref:Uncharacterized protein n=1 Tax=Brassica cretica TaxID=69181 RepID=A0A8S9GGF7_BRACR|nr:hypothetical protein F2Q68_00029995 [Brassica cretica]